MARWRAIHQGISTSGRFVSLPEFDQLLFINMVVQADDFGLLPGETLSLKLKCCPATQRREEEIEESLDRMLLAQLILGYLESNKRVVSICEWDEMQPKYLIGKRTNPKYPLITATSEIFDTFRHFSTKFDTFRPQIETEIETEMEMEIENVTPPAGAVVTPEAGATKSDPFDYAGIMAAWNEVWADVLSMKKLGAMSEKRKGHVRARATEATKMPPRDWLTGGVTTYKIDWSGEATWRTFFIYVRDECHWLYRKWGRMTFDWLVKPDNFLKAVEGNYENEKKDEVPFGQLSAKEIEFYDNL